MGKKNSGKTPQGRAKQKQRAQKSGSSGSPWAKSGQGDFSHDEDEDSPHVMFRGFGGAISRSNVARDPLIKLRHKTIAFVSAGSNMPERRQEQEVDDQEVGEQEVDEQEVDEQEVDEQEVNEALIAAIELNDSDVDVENSMQLDGGADTEVEVQEVEIAEVIGETNIPVNAPESQIDIQQASLHFVVDLVGDAQAVPTRSHIASTRRLLDRASSPTPSDSSEEVILFQGRNRPVVIDDPPQQAQPPAKAVLPSTSLQKTPVTQEEDTSAPQGFTPVPDGPFWRHGGPKNAEEFVAQTEGRETIEMLQAAWKQAKKEKNNMREQVEKDDLKMSRRGKRGRKRSNKLLQSAAIDDSDPEEAAYQDYLENLKAQESQDIVEGEIVDPVADAVNVDGNEQDWEDTEMTAGSVSDEVIGEDLSDVLSSDDDLNASDLESSDLEEELSREEQRMIQAEEALYMRRMQSKNDGQLARLWAKQLELGIDADELIIDDGEEFDVDGVGDIETARLAFADFTSLAEKRPKRSKRRGNNRDISFPDASALADSIEQYGNEGFDIMDYERPSLRPVKNGRKGRMPPELDALSDEEMKENMFSAWDKDRAKKRLKKAEREELRTRGLLGPLAKKGKADLGQKYQQGMTMEQICKELQVFLEDDGKTTQPFPPMDKTDRKALHQIANALNLKSKSVGTGTTRYPVLYKTKNTRDFDEKTFNRAVHAASRGFLKNQAWKGGKGASKPVKRSGGTGMAAAGLRHGEVVGAGAKEIGKESFGHKLMEKMGWTKGTALGKDGEGILVPIEQMMRIGRSGL